MFKIISLYPKKYVYVNNIVIYIVAYIKNLLENVNQKLKFKKVFYSA